MQGFGRFVVKHRVAVLILAFLLLIPAVWGMLATRINYDILTYLPSDMDTVKGQDILLNDFGKGAFSLVIVEDMQLKDVSALAEKIRGIEHVASVIWYDSLMDVTVPMEVLPDEVYDAFNTDNATLVAVFFDDATSADNTLDAIADLRATVGKKCFVTGMSAMVADMRDMCEREEPIYIALAVVCAVVIMMIFMDSYIIPFIFLAGMGMAILYNLGTNYFFGEISYITKALSAVLQLAVTMDYSIFLWHSYCEQKQIYSDRNEAMANAIAATLTSVVGSSLTTVAGFLALCFMSFSLGKDLGLVMAKGVIFGVISCVTVLPDLILVLDKPLSKTMHKKLLPDMRGVSKFIIKFAPIFLVLFVLISVPAFYGNQHKDVYYEISQSLPKDMDFAIANSKLSNDFDMASTHMILVDSHLPQKQMKQMIAKINDVDGVKTTLGLSSVVGSLVPEEVLPESLVEVLKTDKYELLLVNSEYKVASDEANVQINGINSIIKSYDKNSMLIGEAPCTKDLIDVTDYDFKVVNVLSIAAIFIIIAIVFKSISLPVLLVAVIEFAVIVNLGIPYYTNVSLPFIAPICISTIQLGATVDYAILMTTRYKHERASGKAKRNAMEIALSASIPSIVVSALGFFAATFGVSVYSNIDMISSMCSLMARGAVISMFAVTLILPGILMLFDKIICATSAGFKNKGNKNMEVNI